MKNLLSKIFIRHLALLLIFSQNVICEANDFTFFNPIQLNSAFAGSGKTIRSTYSYTDQWSALPGSFLTNNFALDFNLEQLNSGVGFSTSLWKGGVASFQQNNFDLHYAYRLKIGDSTALCFGMRAGYLQNNFSDDYTFISDIVGGESPVLNSEQDGVLNLGAGIGLFSSNYWFGYAVNHLNQSELSSQKLNVQHQLHGSYLVNFTLNAFGTNHYCSLHPVFNLSYQTQNTQFDVGAYAVVDIVIFGAFYQLGSKGELQEKAYHNAPSFSIGFYEHNVVINYMLTIEPALGNSHQIGLFYEIDTVKRRLKNQNALFFPSM